MINFYKLNINFVLTICLVAIPLLYSSKSVAVESDVTDEVVVTARKGKRAY